MKQYTIRNQGTRLYICIMERNIHVEQFRAMEFGGNIEALGRIAQWYVHPPHPTCPSLTRLELVRMIQKLTGDAHNELIDKILHFKPAGKKGDAASTASNSSSQDKAT